MSLLSSFSSSTEVTSPSAMDHSPPSRSRSAQRDLVAVSPAMQRARDRATRAARSDAPVLIVGEAGTGKRFLARSIHDESTRDGPFVAADISSIRDRDSDVALFGAATSTSLSKGAAQEAKGGTLFVPHAGALPAALQVKLLLAAERRYARPVGAVTDEPIDLRVILAAEPDRDPPRSGQPRLRHDIYRQRDVVVIDMPSLRERREDIVPLARLFLERARPGAPPCLSAAVEKELELYAWPGNVRQLESVVVRMCAATPGEELTIECLRQACPDMFGHALEPTFDVTALTYREMLAATRERSTKDYFTALLRAVDGNVTQAAARAGLERESLHRLLKRFGLQADTFRKK